MYRGVYIVSIIDMGRDDNGAIIIGVFRTVYKFSIIGMNRCVYIVRVIEMGKCRI
jgi:hypothetical protein